MKYLVGIILCVLGTLGSGLFVFLGYIASVMPHSDNDTGVLVMIVSSITGIISIGLTIYLIRRWRAAKANPIS